MMLLFTLAAVVLGLAMMGSALAQPLKLIPVHVEARVGLRRINTHTRQRMH